MSILDDLKAGIVRVEFLKQNGDLRVAYMTQCPEIFDALGVENKSRDVIKRDRGSYSAVYYIAEGWRNLSHASVVAWQFATPEQAYDAIEGVACQ
jgi:hypothetical protein